LTWSPRGALQRWEGATKPLAKRAWESVCNALITRKNCVLHVTSKQEALESESRIPNARIAIVPNGVDIPDTLPPKDWLPDGRFRLLYMGRLDPKKGIENLLRALQLLRDDSISLTICGSGDETYSLSLRKLVKQLDLGCCVTFQGHVDGELKSQSFMHADVCVVPSYTENFAMVVAEALAHGIPVIASKGTPWPGLEKKGCGLWIDNSPTALAESIAIIRSKKLDDMGRRGRTWMQKDLGWESVAEEMIALYRSLIERCHRW
jgi:glycosyltransferase involved in cell wall biosynthesis